MQVERTQKTARAWSPLLLFAFKCVVAGLVIVGGVAAGVHLGWSTVLKRAATATVESLQNDSFLDVGDSFPDYALWDPARAARTSVSEVAAEGPALLLFMSPTCGACRSLVGHWNRKVVPGVREDIRVVSVYDDREWNGEDESEPGAELIGAVRLSTSRAEQLQSDGITVTPSLVGLGRDGRIRFVVSGFDRRIDSEFVNRHL